MGVTDWITGARARRERDAAHERSMRRIGAAAQKFVLLQWKQGFAEGVLETLAHLDGTSKICKTPAPVDLTPELFVWIGNVRATTETTLAEIKTERRNLEAEYLVDVILER